MNKRIRQYIGIIFAVLFYYIIHEGAHLLIALFLGVFKEVKFMGIGMQIVIEKAGITDIQTGIFCLAGPIATFICGYILVLLCNKFCRMKSQILKTISWYTTLTMLLLDPIYLGIIYNLFGGGDMNGIALLFPELLARVIFVIIGLMNGVIIYKYILPRYSNSFKNI